MFFAVGEEKRLSFVGLRSCRAGSYFRYAAKVTKGAPKRAGTPFQAVSQRQLVVFDLIWNLPPLPLDRGTPPGVARGLTAMEA